MLSLCLDPTLPPVRAVYGPDHLDAGGEPPVHEDTGDLAGALRIVYGRDDLEMNRIHQDTGSYRLTPSGPIGRILQGC